MTALRTIFLNSLMALIVLTSQGRQYDDAALADSGAVELHEVVVKSEKVKVFADHDEMILSPENRNFGANAIDAISSLPLFRTQVASSELTNLRGENVNVVIDGRFASAEQLATYSGKEIRSVSYYPFTPSRYQGYCTGPLIEVSILRPRNTYVSVNLNEALMGECAGRILPDFLSSSTRGTFTYMDSVNMLKADYRFGYQDKKNLVREIEQRIPDSYSLYSTDHGHERKIGHEATLNYQYDKGANTLSVIAGYNRVPLYSLDMSMISADPAAADNDTRVSQKSQDQEAVSAAVFYDHSFMDRSALTVSAQASATWTDLSESLRIGGPGTEAFERNTVVDSRVMRYSMDINYKRSLGKGQLNARAYAISDHMRQSYCGNMMPHASTTFAIAGVSYNISPGCVSIDSHIGCAMMDNRMRGHDTMTDLSPTGAIRLGWRVNSHMSMRLATNLGASFYSTGLDYDNKYYDGEGYYQKGNFDVRPMVNTFHDLSCSYTGADGRITVGGGASLQYDTNPSFQYIIKDGDEYVRTSLNARRYLSVRPNAYGSFRITGWLSASFYAAYSRYENPYMPYGAAVRLHGLTRLSGQLSANYRGFFISVSAEKGSRVYRGDEQTVEPYTYSAQASWRHKGLFASLTWDHNLGCSTTIMESGVFYWSEFSPKYRPNTLSLNVSYSFNHGIRKQKKTKMISVGTDSGLIRGNM